MKWSISAPIGVCLILAGIALFASAVHWLAPHPDVGFQLPVSLSPGHIATGNFTVEPYTFYNIVIEFDNRSRISAHCRPYSVLNTQFVLSGGGKEEHGSSPWEDTGLNIADIYSESTQYAFDVDVFPGATCLNAGNPRLKVQTVPYPSDLYTALTWFSVFSVGAGLVLLMQAHISRPASEIAILRIFPEMVLRNVLPIKKHRPLTPIQGMPHSGLFFGTLLWILVFTFMMFGPRTSKGLLVNLENHDPVVWEKSPWSDTLEVYIASGRAERFFINGQPVKRSELGSKLKEQLARRAEWTVYFEADPDTEFRDAAYAIDTIQACGAKLIWITPKMRKESQRNNPNHPSP
jgi:biopolymer transport protein ExbD